MVFVSQLLESVPDIVVDTEKSALTVSTEAPLLVHASKLHRDTLPSYTQVLKTPGMVGLHCNSRKQVTIRAER